MSKKKNANIERNTKKKQERVALHKNLEDFIVKHTGIVLILATLFTIFYNYYVKSIQLVAGMRILFTVLIWAGVATVLAGAIIGYIKKNPAIYKWCAIGAANSVIWYVYMQFGQFRGRSYISGPAYCYYAIALYFLFCLAYYILALKGGWNKKPVRVTFYVLAAAAALFWIVTAVVFMYLNGAFFG